jgi:hypothetical protein
MRKLVTVRRSANDPVRWLVLAVTDEQGSKPVNCCIAAEASSEGSALGIADELLRVPRLGEPYGQMKARGGTVPQSANSNSRHSVPGYSSFQSSYPTSEEGDRCGLNSE